jgi:hypothetical protein
MTRSPAQLGGHWTGREILDEGAPIDVGSRVAVCHVVSLSPATQTALSAPAESVPVDVCAREAIASSVGVPVAAGAAHLHLCVCLCFYRAAHHVLKKN